MKKRPLLFIGIVFLCFSCTTHENDFLEETNFTILQNEENKNSEEPNVVSSFSDSPTPHSIPLNEIIVEYQPEVSEEQKEALRNEYGVINYMSCDCSNVNQKYELWVMEAGIDIEPTVKVIKKDNPVVIISIIQNRGFNIPMYALPSESENSPEVTYIESSFNNDYLNRIVDANTGITVAVLDTGIDTQHSGFIGEFLYDSSLNGNCDTISGWDFVNSDRNTYDDDVYKHGTVISYVIHNQLINSKIDHQILPVKIADADGKSTFFNALCGLQYAIDEESDVINLSFGWTATDLIVYDIFSNLIDTTDAIIVTSAGNNDQDNDAIPHYPSNFPQDHVLAIAAAKYNLSDATSYSNYGASTVYGYAIGNKIPFPLKNPNTFSHFNGTSFATPIVSAKVAELISYGSQNIREDLLQQFAFDVNYFSKPVQNMKLIR